MIPSAPKRPLPRCRPFLRAGFASVSASRPSRSDLPGRRLRQMDTCSSAPPTGTGKTLAAMLPVLGDLLRYPEPAGWSDSPLRALYIAPLKALVNDAGRSLEAHLADLSFRLPEGARLPRLAVRTGDTPAEDRRRFREEPPDMLLTTPESLAVLLSQPSCTPVLANLAWVVVDEVHALAGNKRGADLSVSLERLDRLTCTVAPRRIGLSATAAPLAEAARFLVGAERSCNIARARNDRDCLCLWNRCRRGIASSRNWLRGFARAARSPGHAGFFQYAPPVGTARLGAAATAARMGSADRRPSLGAVGGAAARG